MYITSYDHITTSTQFDTLFVKSSRRATNYRGLLLSRSLSERKNKANIKRTKNPSKLSTHYQTEAHSTILTDNERLEKTDVKSARERLQDCSIDISKFITKTGQSAKCERLLKPVQCLVLRKTVSERNKPTEKQSKLNFQSKENRACLTKIFWKKCKETINQQKVLTQNKNKIKTSQPRQILCESKKKQSLKIKSDKKKKIGWLEQENIDPWNAHSQNDEQLGF